MPERKGNFLIDVFPYTDSITVDTCQSFVDRHCHCYWHHASGFFRNWFLVYQSMEWTGQTIWPLHLIPWSQDPARPHGLVIPRYNGFSYTFSAQIHAREGFPQEFAFFVFVFKMPFSLNPQINLLWKCILLRWNWSSAKHTSLVQKP